MLILEKFQRRIKLYIAYIVYLSLITFSVARKVRPTITKPVITNRRKEWKKKVLCCHIFFPLFLTIEHPFPYFIPVWKTRRERAVTVP